jgi:signal transduction histidine kinase
MNHKAKRPVKKEKPIALFEQPVKFLLDSINQGILYFDDSESLVLSNYYSEALLDLKINSQKLKFTDVISLLKISDEEIRVLKQGSNYSIDKEVSGKSLKIRLIEVKEEIIVSRGKAILLNNNFEGDSERVKTAFLSIVSHELRTPLTVIKNVFEIMELSNLKSVTTDLVDVFNLGVKNTKRLSNIIDDLIDVAIIEANTLELKLCEFPISELLDQVIQDIKLSQGKDAVEFVKQVPANLPVAFGDPKRITQILTKIFDNAIKFSPKSPQIQVSVKIAKIGDLAKLERYKLADQHHSKPFSLDQDAVFYITCRDQGVGISTDKFNLIFRKFSQLEDTDTRRYQGIGLGLPIIKSLVERHEGSIWLKSKKNQGTEFSFSLPFMSVDQKKRKLLDEKIKMSHHLSKELLAISMTIPFEPIHMNSSWMAKFEISVAPMIAASLLRSTDVVYYFKEKSLLFLLIMGCKNEHVQTIVRRIENALNSYIGEISTKTAPGFICAHALYPQDAESSSEIIEILSRGR